MICWFQEGGGRGSGGSSPEVAAGRPGGERAGGERGGAERGAGERGGGAGPGGADWVRRERLGKKGEFRYF